MSRDETAAEFARLLPRHDFGITIEHNPHLGAYESVGAYIEETDLFDVTPDDLAECIRTGELWTMQWYPESSVGFCAIAAPTLARLLAIAAGDA